MIFSPPAPSHGAHRENCICLQNKIAPVNFSRMRSNPAPAGPETASTNRLISCNDQRDAANSRGACDHYRAVLDVLEALPIMAHSCMHALGNDFGKWPGRDIRPQTTSVGLL